jgi:regulator of sigma E protease
MMTYVVALLTNIAALVLVLGILIFLHEGGHFLAARAVRARVSVFSFGFGRRLVGFRRGDTDYRLSAIPLGGYVRVHGLGPDESAAVGAAAEEEPLLPRWQRAIVLIGGPLANVLGAVAFLALAFMIGVQVPVYQDQPPEVAWVDPASPAAEVGIGAGDLITAIDGTPMHTWREVEMATLTAPGRALKLRFRRGGVEHETTLVPRAVTSYDLGYAGLAPMLPAEVPAVQGGSAAEKAGLRAGDRITAINGEKVRHFFDLMRIVGSSPGRELTITVVRGTATVALKATPDNVGGVGKLGIPVPRPTALKRLSFLPALGEGARECERMTRETFAIIARLVTGRTSLKQMSGPIGIARFSGEAARAGLDALIWVLGLISLQLAIFNLLPIPLLDGGHLTVTAIEAARRRDFSVRTKERIMNIGFWLIVLLLAVVIYNDLAKIPLLRRAFEAVQRLVAPGRS